MRRHIQLWGTRLLSVALVVFATQHWGMPLYKQYVTPKKKAVFTPTAKVKEGRFVISFHQIGTLEAEKSVSVSSEIEGKIISLVEDGKVVAAGDNIAVLDTTNIENEILTKQLKHNQAMAEVESAKANLEILREQNKTVVAQSQAELDFNKSESERVQKDLEKKKRLADQKLIPRDQVEQAEIEVRTKDLEVRKGEMQLEFKKKEALSEEEQKKANVANAESVAGVALLDLQRSQNMLTKATITAPAPGMVILTIGWIGGDRRKVKEGDGIWRTFRLCELPDLSCMLVKAEVGESDAPKTKVGMPVLIRLEAVPKKIFHGTITSISNLATEKMVWDGGEPGKKNFEVKIGLRESDPKNLKPGMTADVEFVEKTIQKAVYVPIEAVIEQSGKTFVFVKTGTRFVRTPVKTGAQNDSFVVIEKGLAKGQTIALRDPTRPLDEQDSKSKTEADEKKEQKQAAPIPAADKAKK